MNLTDTAIQDQSMGVRVLGVLMVGGDFFLQTPIYVVFFCKSGQLEWDEERKDKQRYE